MSIQIDSVCLFKVSHTNVQSISSLLSLGRVIGIQELFPIPNHSFVNVQNICRIQIKIIHFLLLIKIIKFKK